MTCILNILDIIYLEDFILNEIKFILIFTNKNN